MDTLNKIRLEIKALEKVRVAPIMKNKIENLTLNNLIMWEDDVKKSQ